jgi:hypothetical protein
MQAYFIVGVGTGCMFYVIKLIGFYIGTQSCYTRWIRTLFHKTAFGLFLLDLLAGMVITGTIHTVGADGLTALFIFIGFSLSSILYILSHIAVSQTKEVIGSCRNGRLFSSRF